MTATRCTNGSIQLPSTAGDTVQQTFTMLDDLGYSWLVAGGDPTSIAINHDVWWHPLSSSLTMDGWPDKGESYQVTSTYANPTAADLAGRNTIGRRPGPYTELPRESPIPSRQTRPRCVDRGRRRPLRQGDGDHAAPQVAASSRYDPNVDLQDNSQALADFLSQKKGFCQQFASLMAVMLRSIGIPARIGFGFTQGDPVANETGTYIVHGHDYHSWVEVPFDGYGWLTFDPTPGFARPVEPQLREVHHAGPTVLSRAGPQLQWLDTATGTSAERTRARSTWATSRPASPTASREARRRTPRRALGGITLSNLVTIAAALGRPARDRDPAAALAPAAQAPAHRPRSSRR